MTPSWKVFTIDFSDDTAKQTDIFQHGRFVDDLGKVAKEYDKNLKGGVSEIEARAKFDEQVRCNLLYFFWAKFEWEILIVPLITRGESIECKVDVYTQVMQNWDVFREYVFANRAFFKREYRKNHTKKK